MPVRKTLFKKDGRYWVAGLDLDVVAPSSRIEPNWGQIGSKSMAVNLRVLSCLETMPAVVSEGVAFLSRILCYGMALVTLGQLLKKLNHVCSDQRSVVQFKSRPCWSRIDQNWTPMNQQRLCLAVSSMPQTWNVSTKRRHDLESHICWLHKCPCLSWPGQCQGHGSQHGQAKLQAPHSSGAFLPSWRSQRAHDLI